METRFWFMLSIIVTPAFLSLTNKEKNLIDHCTTYSWNNRFPILYPTNYGLRSNKV